VEWALGKIADRELNSYCHEERHHNGGSQDQVEDTVIAVVFSPLKKILLKLNQIGFYAMVLSLFNYLLFHQLLCQPLKNT
jgi:hypothetical protein